MMFDYPIWYQMREVKFEIIKFTQNREIVFIHCPFSRRQGRTTRMARIHNVQSLDLWLKSMQIWNDRKDYNLYYSLAKYRNGIPFGSLNLAERDFGDWNKECWKEMVAYDFFIDIDATNFKEVDFAYSSAKSIKKLFDKLEVPYNLRFSGRGFHFIIPDVYFKDLQYNFNPYDIDNIYDLYREIAIVLNEKFSEMVDTSIYDYRRVIKIPYSLALYKDKCLVCMPFNSDEEFNNFELKNMEARKFSGYIKNRGEKLFNEKGNIFKLLKELKIKNG